jgi:hypothetical protein
MSMLHTLAGMLPTKEELSVFFEEKDDESHEI